MKRVLTLIVLTVSLAFLIPLNQGFAEELDPLERLNNSTILVNEKQLSFSNNIEIRQFANSHFIKIQGQTTTGEILIVFLKDNNPNFQMVMVVSEGKFHKGSLIPKIEPIKEYNPDLIITSNNDLTTYWNSFYEIDVQVFDGNINQDPKSHEFDGRIDVANITVNISLDGQDIATLEGVTSNGHWQGEYFISYHTPSGEYNVEIIASNGNQTVSKNTSMFVISTLYEIPGA